MMYAVINAYVNRTLLMDIRESTPDFDYSVVDHDHLADMIGKAIVRAVNHARTQGEPINSVRFTVDFQHA